jgi:hypothetical protein
MTEMFRYYAKCNMLTNQTIIDIVRTSDKKPYNTPVEGYYKSIAAILDSLCTDNDYSNTILIE